VRYYATLDGRTYELEPGEGYVTLDGRRLPFELESLGPGEAHARVGTRSFHVFARPIAGGWRVRVGGRVLDIEVEDERARHIRELTGAVVEERRGDLRAPMPGLVVKVLVEPGQSVAPGDGLVVVEAMKMENELRAEGAGTVASVEVSAGQAVDRDEVLVRFEAGR